MWQTRGTQLSALALIMVSMAVVAALLTMAAPWVNIQQAQSLAQPIEPTAASPSIVQPTPAALTPALKSLIAANRLTATVLPTIAPSPTPTPPFFGKPETIGTSVQGRPLIPSLFCSRTSESDPGAPPEAQRWDIWFAGESPVRNDSEVYVQHMYRSAMLGADTFPAAGTCSPAMVAHRPFAAAEVI